MVRTFCGGLHYHVDFKLRNISPQLINTLLVFPVEILSIAVFGPLISVCSLRDLF